MDSNNIYLEALHTYLKSVKKEIEKDGGIATIDEAIDRVEKEILADAKRMTEHND